MPARIELVPKRQVVELFCWLAQEGIERIRVPASDEFEGVRGYWCHSKQWRAYRECKRSPDYRLKLAALDAMRSVERHNKDNGGLKFDGLYD